jgi:hypothetical protein
MAYVRKIGTVAASEARKILIICIIISATLLNFPLTVLPYTSFEQAFGQEVGGNSFFPNATSAIPGNQSIIPGLHVMSLVNGVKMTWIIISSENELSVNLRYTGNGTTPPLSLLATALKSPLQPQAPGGLNASALERASGSNITSVGWISPSTIPIRLEGGMSLYDADLIIVMVVPNTASPPTSNSSLPASP